MNMVYNCKHNEKIIEEVTDMIFNVMNKNNGIVYEVYDIAYDKSGYPHFLIYKDDQWLRMSAKYFVPIDDDCLKAI